MRPVLVLVALAGAAHAQPGQSALIAPAPEPLVYVQAGIALGGDGANGGGFGALTAEAGYRLGGSWWLHGEGLIGTTNDNASGPQYKGTIRQLRLGGEWHHRWLVLGLDVGFTHETEVSDTNVEIPDHEYAGGMFAARVAGDFWIADHMWIRPGLELFGGGKLPDQPASGGKNYGAGDLSVSIAYIW